MIYIYTLDQDREAQISTNWIVRQQLCGPNWPDMLCSYTTNRSICFNCCTSIDSSVRAVQRKIDYASFFLGLFGVNVWEHRLEVFKLTRVGFRELQNLNTNTWIVNSNCDALLHFLTSACWSLLHHTIVHCVLFIRSHWMLSHQFEDIVGGRGGSSHILNIYT
jgi:hypothetical protein